MNAQYDRDADFEAKRGMSTGAKVVVGILICLGVLLIACCGGCYYFVNYRLEDMVENAFRQTTTPAEVDKVRESFITMEIPEEYVAQSAMEMNIMGSMKMAMYARDRSLNNSALILMYMNFPGTPSREQMEAQFDQQSDQFQQDHGDLKITETEIVPVMIEGKEVDFEFAKGTKPDTENVGYRVTGMFAGDTGVIMVTLMEDEETWDRDAVIQMLETIQTGTPPEEPIIKKSGFEMDIETPESTPEAGSIES